MGWVEWMGGSLAKFETGVFYVSGEAGKLRCKILRTILLLGAMLCPGKLLCTILSLTLNGGEVQLSQQDGVPSST